MGDSNSWVDPFGLQDLHFKDFNQAMFGNKGKNNGALDWLLERGFKAEKQTKGKFGNIAENPVGMQTNNGKVGFRIEYDTRSGAHINVWSGKEKGPHFKFEASEKTVNKLQKRYKCK